MALSEVERFREMGQSLTPCLVDGEGPFLYTVFNGSHYYVADLPDYMSIRNFDGGRFGGPDVWNRWVHADRVEIVGPS